jgi:flagellar basal body-associated protein FliL
LEKKGNFFILLIIIAVLTLIIAVLAAFIVIVGINGSPQVASEAAGGGGADDFLSVTPPDESTLATMPLFADRQFFNLRNTAGSSQLSVCIVDVSIKYFTKVDGIKDVPAKLELNQGNMKEIVSTYFQELTRDEIEMISTKADAKENLKKELNEFLISTISSDKDRKKVSEIVYEVVFSGWNYQ